MLKTNILLNLLYLNVLIDRFAYLQSEIKVITKSSLH